MSWAALLGALFGIGLVIGSIILGTDHYGVFFNLHSIMMVLGGSIATAYMSYQHTYVNIAFKAIWWILKKPSSTREGLNVEILRLIKWAYIVQQKGLPALENEVKNTKMGDPLLEYCLLLVTTAHKPEELRFMMENAVESEFERRTTPVAVLKNMASSGPAFGMLGTLTGMVIMLQDFSGDMAVIGQGMSLALTATLYGVILARLIFLPAALKLQHKEEIERFRNYLIVEGLVMLAEKKGPHYMQDRLNSFLDPENHFNISKQIKNVD